MTTDLLYLQMHKNPVATTEINLTEHNIKILNISTALS